MAEITINPGTPVLAKDVTPLPEKSVPSETALPTQELIDWLQTPENASKYKPELVDGFTTVGKVSNNFDKLTGTPDAKQYNPFVMMLGKVMGDINGIVRSIESRFPDNYAQSIETHRSEILQCIKDNKTQTVQWMPEGIGSETMEQLANPPSQDAMNSIGAAFWYDAIRADSRIGQDPTPANQDVNAPWNWLVEKYPVRTHQEKFWAKIQGDSESRYVVRIRGAQINPDMSKALQDWYIAQPAKALEVFKKIRQPVIPGK